MNVVLLESSKIMIFATQASLQFWSFHPALLYGIACMLGVFCHLASSTSLVIVPLLLLWFPFLFSILYLKDRSSARSFVLSVIVFIAAWEYTAAHHTLPSLPKEGMIGTGHIKIRNISTQSNLFGERFVYRCDLVQFFPESTTTSIASSLPCVIVLPTTRERPAATQEYFVTGTLMETEKGSYILKVPAKSNWIPIKDTWSLAEDRYIWKKNVSEWIESKFLHPPSGLFLAGLATGEFDDYWMRQQFTRFGVQHLLAISGFHFAIIAGCLSLVLSLFFTIRWKVIILILALGTYCFFLGPQASILRAWLMSFLGLIGILLEKQTTALNSLGIALMAILGYHPPLCLEIGFLLSFTTTAAILLFYRPAEEWLSTLFPKRPLHVVLTMNGWNQHAYCLLSFLRQGMAMTIAVNLVALPLTLYCFQQFPWMSLFYNLFFPLMASFSLCLFLLGTLLFFIPFLADAIHHINDAYTFFLLQLTQEVPTAIDSSISMELLPSIWLICYLSVIGVGGIIWRARSTIVD